MLTITNVFILICILIFIYIHFISKENSFDTVMRIGALYPAKIQQGQYWRIITSHFIHENFFHLIMNMYCIYYLGNFFESLFGPVLYLGLVFMGMLVSSMTTVIAPMYFPSTSNHVTYGASGIFYAYLGAMIGLALYRGGVFSQLLSANMSIIAINIIFTLINPGISKTGHFGGLLGGYLFTFLLYILRII